MALIRKTWGMQIAGNVRIGGLIALVAVLPGILFAVVGGFIAISGTPAAGILLAAIGVIVIIAAQVLISAMRAIFSGDAALRRERRGLRTVRSPGPANGRTRQVDAAAGLRLAVPRPGDRPDRPGAVPESEPVHRDGVVRGALARVDGGASDGLVQGWIGRSRWPSCGGPAANCSRGSIPSGGFWTGRDRGGDRQSGTVTSVTVPTVDMNMRITV